MFLVSEEPNVFQWNSFDKYGKPELLHQLLQQLDTVNLQDHREVDSIELQQARLAALYVNLREIEFLSFEIFKLKCSWNNPELAGLIVPAIKLEVPLQKFHLNGIHLDGYYALGPVPEDRKSVV